MDKAQNINTKSNANTSSNSSNTNSGAISDLNSNYKLKIFDFVGKRNLFFIIAGIIILVGVVSSFVRGYNLDIDFVGGTILEYNLGKTVDSSDTDKVRTLITEAVGADILSSITTLGDDGVSIKTKQIDSEDRDKITKALESAFTIDPNEIAARNVNATVGKTLTYNTILAVSVALVLMLIYIAIRFELFSGLAAVLCLTQDLLVTLVFYSLFQIPMNVSTIAAFLTILGYSINATIIVFDRVRENLKLHKDMEFKDIINLSASQTLMRSVNTTITTLFTVVCVYIFGVPSIKAFVFPLIVGITTGLYTSVCMSGCLWFLFKKGKR